MIVERKDGTLMYVNVNAPQLYDSNGKLDIYHVTVTDKDGNTYMFTADSDEALRTTLSGNLTNATGHPLPAFVIKKSA